MSAVQLAFPGFVSVKDSSKLPLPERFRQFHEANPWVADELERLAMEDIAYGETRIGIKHYVEVLRRQYRRATTGSKWAFDNSLTSRYARLLIERRPELADVIETRELRS